MGAEIGAPPDPLALKGQGWGIPPPDPVVMRGTASAGLHQPDPQQHALLRRASPGPCDVAVPPLVGGGRVIRPRRAPTCTTRCTSSSRRWRWRAARTACVVVGEDLGTVPDEMRRAMHQFGLYHYKVMLFEKQDGRFRRPDEFVRRALATVTTHDMPTLRSFWEGRDIELRRRLHAVSERGGGSRRAARARTGPRVAAYRTARAGAGARQPCIALRTVHARSWRTRFICTSRAPIRRWPHCRSRIYWEWSTR